MNKCSITTDEMAACLLVLKRAARPLVAADIATDMGLAGCRETKRRHVRALVRQLRDDGARVIGDLQQGYWLTDDEHLWRDYIEGRQIDAKRIFADTHKKKKMLADAAGQGFLFQQRMTGGFAAATA